VPHGGGRENDLVVLAREENEKGVGPRERLAGEARIAFEEAEDAVERPSYRRRRHAARSRDRLGPGRPPPALAPGSPLGAACGGSGVRGGGGSLRRGAGLLARRSFSRASRASYATMIFWTSGCRTTSTSVNSQKAIPETFVRSDRASARPL